MVGMNYRECDVPEGMTLIQWRRRHRPAAGAKRRRRWLRAVALARSLFA
jgi:hypothetical protein